jgi:hypothetical protein
LKRPNYKIIGSKIDFSSLFLSPPITSSNRSTTRLQVKFWATKPGPATLAFAAIPGCSIALRIKSVKCSHSGAKINKVSPSLATAINLLSIGSAKSDRVKSSVGPPSVQITGKPQAAASNTGRLKPSAKYGET